MQIVIFLILSLGLKLFAFPLSPERHPIPVEKREDESRVIQKIAAIGDSYSAGIGAGKRLGFAPDKSNSQFDDWKCKHGALLIVIHETKIWKAADTTTATHPCWLTSYLATAGQRVFNSCPAPAL
jgi:hypothetical protein